MRSDLILQQIHQLAVRYPELAGDEEAWAVSIESETDTKEFLRSVERKRRDAVAMIKAVDSTVVELLERMKRFERREEAMRVLAFKVMEAADLRKIELPEATLSIANGQQRVLVLDADALPNDLTRIKREPDKAAIKKILETGEEVSGAVLSNAEPYLTIRTR
jgi:hypothetical protein